MSLLAVTKFELQDIRKALLASTTRAEGYKEKVSEGLRVINAILDKNIEVVPANAIEEDGIPDPWETGELGCDEEYVAVVSEEEEEAINHGC